jgi:Putative member of DMT superfamily (DUF486)
MPVDLLEHLHERSLVWSPQVQREAAGGDHPRKLGHRSLEYCFQVPANRIGSDVLTVTQLKVIQEIITILTFGFFAFVVFRERPTVNHGIAFALLIGAAYFASK